MVTLSEAFGSFTDSAFKLETRQLYRVDGDEARLRAFGAERPLPPRPAKTADMALVRDATSGGKRVYRAHVVEFPLTEYVRFELAAYQENVTAGEEIFITDRAAHPGLAALVTDFWLFDGDTDHASVVWFRYTPDGVCIGRDYSDKTADADYARRHRDLALANSVRLSAFMTRPGVR